MDEVLVTAPALTVEIGLWMLVVAGVKVVIQMKATTQDKLVFLINHVHSALITWENSTCLESGSNLMVAVSGTHLVNALDLIVETGVWGAKLGHQAVCV